MDEAPKPDPAIMLNFACDVIFENVRTPLWLDIWALSKNLFAEVGGCFQS